MLCNFRKVSCQHVCSSSSVTRTSHPLYSPSEHPSLLFLRPHSFLFSSPRVSSIQLLLLATFFWSTQLFLLTVWEEKAAYCLWDECFCQINWISLLGFCVHTMFLSWCWRKYSECHQWHSFCQWEFCHWVHWQWLYLCYSWLVATGEMWLWHLQLGACFPSQPCKCHFLELFFPNWLQTS